MALAFQSNAFENSAFEVGAGGVNYSLTCAAGSYALTGQAANLKQGHSLICSSGSYALSGQSANLKQAHKLICIAGAYSYTGQTTTLNYTAGSTPAVNYSLICSAGSYTETGINSGLKVARTLICAAGSYSSSGQPTLLKLAHALVAGSGSYSLSGVSANLRVSRSMACNAGSYSLSGQPTNSRIARRLTCNAGSYSLAGENATFSYVNGAVPQNYTLTCNAGSYTVFEQGYIAPDYVDDYFDGNTKLTYTQVPVEITRQQANYIEHLARLHGLIDPLQVSATARSDGTVIQTISESGGAVTIATTSVANTKFNPLWIDSLAALYGLTGTLTVTDTSRISGAVSQSITSAGGVVTVTTS